MDPSSMVGISSSSSDKSSDQEINMGNAQALTMVAKMAYYMLQHMRSPTTRMAINIDHEVAHECLMHDYFAENPLHGEDIFRRIPDEQRTIPINS